MRKILFLFVFFSLSGISAFGQTAPIGEILKRMEGHRKTLKSLSADITITKFSVSSVGTYTKECTVKFLPGVGDFSLRMDSTKPAPESFAVVNNKFVLHLPDSKNAFLGELTEAQKNSLFIFSNSPWTKLTQTFDVRYLGQHYVGTTPTWHLELKPKKLTTYKSIELWVDGNGMVMQSRLIESAGEWTNTLIGNPSKNIKLRAADFRIVLPKGTSIIKN